VAKNKRNLESDIDDLREEVSMLNTMLVSLVEVLEAKGIMIEEEWEKKIKQNLSAKQVVLE
jgi:hypothetical protein